MLGGMSIFCVWVLNSGSVVVVLTLGLGLEETMEEA